MNFVQKIDSFSARTSLLSSPGRFQRGPWLHLKCSRHLQFLPFSTPSGLCASTSRRILSALCACMHCDKTLCFNVSLAAFLLKHSNSYTCHHLCSSATWNQVLDHVSTAGRISAQARQGKSGSPSVHHDISVCKSKVSETRVDPQVASLRKHTKAYLDCHLCVMDPAAYVAPMAEAGANQLTFHLEVRDPNCQLLVRSSGTHSPSRHSMHTTPYTVHPSLLL